MTKHENILKRLQRSVAALIRDEIRFGGLPPLYTNNHNRQAMIFYEVFRHTAYAVLDDGGSEFAIELMTQVAREMRAFDHIAKEKGAPPDIERFRSAWTNRTSFQALGWFDDCEMIEEITYDEGDSPDPLYKPNSPGWVMTGGSFRAGLSRERSVENPATRQAKQPTRRK